MSLPLTTEQLRRWRALYARHATAQLRLLAPAQRRPMMGMMRAAEDLSARGIALTDDTCRVVFFQSVSPGFLLRSDETIAACRAMMRDAANHLVPSAR